MIRTDAAVYTFEEIEIGAIYTFTKLITQDHVSQFATLTGDRNPLHLDESFGRSSKFRGNLVHGMLTASLFSTLIGMYCPGEKSLYLRQTLQFRKPLFCGETVRVKGTVMNKVKTLQILKMKTEIFRDDDLIVNGVAQVKFMD